MSYAPGTRVRIALRYPEDEGYAKRILNGAVGVIVACRLHPGDQRVCVSIDNSAATALIDPSELSPLLTDAERAAMNAVQDSERQGR